MGFAFHGEDGRGLNCFGLNGGWFISREIKSDSYRNFDFDPYEASGTPLGFSLRVLSRDHESPLAIFRMKEQGKIIYLDIVLEKTPPEKRLTLSGKVFDETEQPVADVDVRLSFAGQTGNSSESITIKTDNNGR